MNNAVRNYALVTGAYWGFTLTDGALRMLVLLHFDQLGIQRSRNRLSVFVLRVLRHRHESAWWLDRRALRSEGYALRRAAPSDWRADHARTAAAGLVAAGFGDLCDGGSSTFRHRQRSDQNERQERDQSRGSRR